jgi:hypothetical protein
MKKRSKNIAKILLVQYNIIKSYTYTNVPVSKAVANLNYILYLSGFLAAFLLHIVFKCYYNDVAKT